MEPNKDQLREYNQDNDYRAILGSFVPSRLHLKLVGEEQDYRPPIGAVHRPQNEATLVHEQMHYYQTAMTAYGQTVWHSYREAASHVVNEWIRATQSSPKNRRIPLAYLAKRSKRHQAFAMLEDRTCKEILGLLSARSYVHPPTRKLEELGLHLVEKPWQISPSITVDGETYLLHGIDILESHAKFLEGTYSLIMNDIPMADTINPRKIPKRYYVTFLWFIQEVGPERILEFPVICDLALQALWSDPPKSELEWRASHPGWRFVKLTDALKARRPLPFSNTKDALERYTAYCVELLSNCGFPTLDETLERTLSRYDKPELTRLEIRMMDALRFRKEYPWCGANPFLDLDVWVQMKKRFVAPLQQVGEETATTIVEGELPPDPHLPASGLQLENIVELHLQALAFQILGQHPPRYTGKADEIQCGYGYFAINKGCHYQISDACPASFTPKKGLPIPLTALPDGNMAGCSFGMLLTSRGLSATDIDVDFSHRMLSWPKIRQTQRGSS